MADLLGEDVGLAEIHKLYRCQSVDVAIEVIAPEPLTNVSFFLGTDHRTGELPLDSRDFDRRLDATVWNSPVGILAARA